MHPSMVSGPKSRGLTNATNKQIGSNGSTLANRKGSQPNNGDQRGSQLEGSDSKLGRKGERPTVAQILEIGVSSTG